MNILYGVSGEGFGHSSRAKEVINYLLQKGHKVLILTYGQAYPILKEYNPIKIEGVHVCYNKKGLSLNRTIFKNINVVIKNITNWREISEKIKQFSPNIGISDMEPIVPFFCYSKKVPLVSIDNQHRLTHIKLKIPKKYKKNYLLVKYFIRSCVPRADAYIILSFIKEKTKKKNAFIVNPILRKEILDVKPQEGDYILVYQTKEDKRLIRILKKIPEKFIIYGYNKEKIDSNLIYKKDNFDFIKNLISAKAIIGTAGFTLISEAIYLKKPYFAFPLKGQFEQTLNALFLKEYKIGDFSEEPTRKGIESFIKNLEIYKENLKNYNIDSKEIFKVLDKTIKELEN